MESLVYNENIDTEDLSERANIVESCEEAMDVIKKYEDIIETNKKSIIFFAYQQVTLLENLGKIENLKVLLSNLR